MSAIREEIVKLTKFKGDDAMYEDDTQEYLAALLLAVDKMSAKEYDKLSDDAYNWHVDAVKAKDNDQEIPDFPVEEVIDDEADQEAGEPADDADPDEDEDEAGDEPADEPAGEAPETDDADGTEVDGPLPVEAEPSAPPANPVKPRAKKEAKKPERSRSADVEPAPKKAGKKPKNFKNTRDYTTLTGEVDKFGVTIGTKTHEAVKMYEKGCTAAQLEDTIGGRHYNILAKLIKDGHKVEKLEGGVWKLTHKDSVKKGKK